MSEETVEEQLAIRPAEVIARGSIPDVQIADDKDWFVLVDTTALCFTQRLGFSQLYEPFSMYIYTCWMLGPYLASVSFG
jgi:hypothetical protein